MSRFPLSPSQAAAVHHAAGDACVLAGAGSGKTVVLAERFVHLVRTTTLGVRDIAALTFTEKAAAEMRERIARTFEAAGMVREAADVEFAQVSTIHAFCARLLRLHAVDAGVDPAFGVMETGEARLTLEDAFAQAEVDLAEDEDALRVRLLLPGQDPSALLLALHSQLRGAGVEAASLTWHVESEAACESAGGTAAARVTLAQQALATFAEAQGDVPDAYAARFADVCAKVATCLETQASAQDPTDSAAMIEAAFAPAAMASHVARFKPRPTKKSVTGSRTVLVKRLEALAARRLDLLGEQRVLPALRRWLVQIELRYRELKDERAVLDFTDLEVETLRLLESLAARGRAPDLAPKALLVDEYQDTNPLQARILGVLRGPDVAQFSVGDPKQSIYRFRRADVSVILAEQAAAAKDARFELATSYRTHPELLRRINALEANLFEGGRAGVDYNALHAGGTFEPTPEPPFEYVVVDAGSATKIEGAREAEARYIAERIVALTDGEVLRTKGGAAGTPFEYGDIALLFRARTSLRIYEQALREAGIPYLTLAGSGYLEASEIEDLVALLRVVHNPSDEHALARVVTGPAFAASDAALLRWFDGSGRGAYTRMQAEVAEGGRHVHAVTMVERLRRVALEGSLADVLQGVLRELGVLETTLLAGEGGYRRAANLRKAIHLTGRLEARGERGLGDLLRYLEDLRTRGVSESEAAVGGEQANVVRLTTVHGSKGLEYPVVFLADTGRRPPSRGTTQGLLSTSGALALRLQDPIEGTAVVPGGRAELEEEDTAAEGRERQRLLYVALTRAEERLVMTVPCSGFTKKATPKGAFSWGREVFDALQAPDGFGDHTMPIGDTDLLVRVVDAEAAGLLEPATPVPEVVGTEPAPQDPRVTDPSAIDAVSPGDLVPLGGTRFVVTVSELLRFAESPRTYYEDIVLLGDQVTRAAAGASAEQSSLAMPSADGLLEGEAAPQLGARALRDNPWDEVGDGEDAGASGSPASSDLPSAQGTSGLSRASLGRAVHAAIEAWIADPAAAEDALYRALEGELAGAPSDALRAEAATLLARFQASSVAADIRAATARGDVVRSELDFHARIRFPGGEPVAGFDALLVKGSIDLWLPTADGLLVLDHKTNRKSSRFKTPEDLAAHYGPQLRLYALAAERLTGADIHGAALLLLDPSWGPEVLTVPIPIDGDRLEETRRLCQAFAESARQGRYPDDWRSLLPDPAIPG